MFEEDDLARVVRQIDWRELICHPTDEEGIGPEDTIEEGEIVRIDFVGLLGKCFNIIIQLVDDPQRVYMVKAEWLEKIGA